VFTENFSLVGITDVLPSGATQFTLDCNQGADTPDQYHYANAAVTALAISPN
jgi:hypothetical protein